MKTITNITNELHVIQNRIPLMKLSFIIAISAFTTVSSSTYANQVTQPQNELSQNTKAQKTLTKKEAAKLKRKNFEIKAKKQIENLTPPRVRGGIINRTGGTLPTPQNSISPRILNVSRINPLNVLTSSDTVTWRVKFTEAVTNVDASDFSVNYGTLNVSPVSADTYDVTVPSGLAPIADTITLNLATTTNILDVDGGLLIPDQMLTAPDRFYTLIAASGTGSTTTNNSQNNGTTTSTPLLATTIDACASLRKGLYAFEKWRSPGLASDDAWVDESDMQYLSLMSNDVLRWSESEWQGPSQKSTAGDKVSTFTQMWVETPPDSYAIDTVTMTEHSLGDLGVIPANKIACNGNAVTFSNYNDSMNYDLTFSAVDITGQYVTTIMPDLMAELGETTSTQVFTFPAQSKKVTGQLTFNKPLFSAPGGNEGLASGSSGGYLATFDYATLSSANSYTTFYIDDGSDKLEVYPNGTVKLSSTGVTGTWQVANDGGGDYLQTNLDMHNEGTIFLIEVGGKLKWGLKFPTGRSIPIGQPGNMMMEDIMLNKEATDGFFNYQGQFRQ